MRFISTGKYITIITALSVFACFLLIGVNSAWAENFEEKVEKDENTVYIDKVEVGEVPPEIVAVDMNGEDFILSELLGETPIVIDFWATWCPPCLREIPLLVEFHEEYGNEVLMVGLTSEGEDSTDIILEFMEENDVTYRMIQQPSRDAITAYNVTGIPTLIVIGGDGLVAGIHVGFSEGVIDEVLEDLGIESHEEVEEIEEVLEDLGIEPQEEIEEIEE